MKKRIIKLGVYLVVVIFFVLGALIANNLLGRENFLDNISEWPKLEIKTLDRETFLIGDLPGELPVLLIYFNTECIFCRHKFAEILADGQLQHEALLVFTSDEAPEIVSAFLLETGMDREPDFVFLYDENRKIRKYFGIRSVPATYLYSNEGRLIQNYIGQVGVENLRSHFSPGN